MIELTRLNGNPLVVNSDLIKWAEAAPDTMLTLVTGEKVVVLESCADVLERIAAYRAGLLAEVVRLAPGLPGLAAAASAPSGFLASSGPPKEIALDLESAQRRRREQP